MVRVAEPFVCWLLPPSWLSTQKIPELGTAASQSSLAWETRSTWQIRRQQGYILQSHALGWYPWNQMSPEPSTAGGSDEWLLWVEHYIALIRFSRLSCFFNAQVYNAATPIGTLAIDLIRVVPPLRTVEPDWLETLWIRQHQRSVSELYNKIKTIQNRKRRHSEWICIPIPSLY